MIAIHEKTLKDLEFDKVLEQGNLKKRNDNVIKKDKIRN